MSEWIISSSVLIVLVIALRHVLRGKINLRLQYALWLVVLVRLLMPISIADSSFSIASFLQKNQTHQISDIFLWYGGEANPGGAGEYLPDRGENGEQGNQQVGGENPGNVTTPINPDAGVTVKPPVTDEPVKYPTIGGISISPSTEKLENSGKEHIALSKILMVIWCAGMAVTAVILLVSNLHFNSKIRKTRWLYEKKTDSLPVYESDAVETPCLFGLVHPAIYVTKEAVKDPNVMHHVLAHETTHYAHRDHIWAVLRCLCLVLHWYNPLVWWAADISRRDAELACDEGTIERIGEAVRAEYGRTLIGLTCQGRGYLLSTATTMTGSVKGIKERIMLIANRPKMARYTVMLLIVLVMVMIGCTYCGVDTSGENLESGGVYIVEGSKMLSPITEEQRLEIEKAWGSPLGWTRGPGSDRYYGNYNGAVVIFTSGMLSEIGEVEVAGVLFTHGTNCDLRVYKDGTIYSLKEAYYGGLLTREDLLTMQEYHWLYEKTERGTMLSNFEMKEEVEAAWAKKKWSNLKWYGLGGDIRYYGTYEGAVVLFEPTGGKKETTLLVGNCKITSKGSFKIHVYKGGEFYLLEKAYEKGFMTASDLISVSTIHKASYEEYEEYQASLEQPLVNIHAKKPVTAGNEIVQRFDAGTTVLADINADGVQEKVTVSQEAHFYIDGRYEFCMQIDDEYYDQFDLDKLGNMSNPDIDHFYLVDLDKSDGWLEIGLFARGQDGNKPKLTLIRYQYGEIDVVGIVYGDIQAEEGSESWIKIHGDGTVESRATDDSNPTAYVTKYWKLKDASELKAVLAEVVTEEPPTVEPGNLHTDDVVEAGKEIVQTIDTGKTVLVDLDGDGIEEKITVKVNKDAREYDAFCMQVNDTYYDSVAFNQLLGYFENIEREHFYLIDIDTSDYWIDVAFYEASPSGDPETTILRYQDGELVRMGSVPVGPPKIEPVGNRELNISGDGTIYGSVWENLVLGADFLPKTWKVEKTDKGLPTLVEIIPEYYSLPQSDELSPKFMLYKEITFFVEKKEDSELITLPARTEMEIQRFYPEGGWIQITYEQGNKVVWLKRD